MGQFRGISRDTRTEVARLQFELYRRIGPEGRVKKMLSMCEFIRSVTEAGIRHRHPEYDDEQVRLALGRLRVGESLFRQAYPGVDVKP